MHLTSSREWIDYFAKNDRQLLSVPWELGADVMPGELAAIGRSLQAWQLGETSEGKQLIAAAEVEAGPAFPSARSGKLIIRSISEKQRPRR